MANFVHFGMPQCANPAYGAAASLSYWVFLCRDRERSPAKGFEIWNFLVKAIRQSAFPARSIDEYLELLSKRLVVASLRPDVLAKKIVRPDHILLRVPVTSLGAVAIPDFGELQQLDAEQNLSAFGWHDILRQCQAEGFSELDVLSLCKSQSHVIGAICRYKHLELFGEKASELEEEKVLSIDVEAETEVLSGN